MSNPDQHLEPAPKAGPAPSEALAAKQAAESAPGTVRALVTLPGKKSAHVITLLKRTVRALTTWLVNKPTDGEIEGIVRIVDKAIHDAQTAGDGLSSFVYVSTDSFDWLYTPLLADGTCGDLLSVETGATLLTAAELAAGVEAQARSDRKEQEAKRDAKLREKAASVRENIRAASREMPPISAAEAEAALLEAARDYIAGGPSEATLRAVVAAAFAVACALPRSP